MALILRLVLLILIVYFALRLFRKLTQLAKPTGRTSEDRARHDSSRDPYAVLGLKPPVSRLEIQKAYKKQLAKYHPDKVNHLGEEIQILAKTKTQEIIHAYEVLK